MDRQAGDRAAEPGRRAAPARESSRPRRRAGGRTSRGTASCATSWRSTRSPVAGCRRWCGSARSAQRCRRRSARRSSGSARRGRRGGWPRSKHPSKRWPLTSRARPATASRSTRRACARSCRELLARDGEPGPKDRAASASPSASTPTSATTTDRLIEIHGLEGRASAEVLARLAGDFAVAARVSEGKAAVLGGLVSGALSGLVGRSRVGRADLRRGAPDRRPARRARRRRARARLQRRHAGRPRRRCAGARSSSTGSSPRHCSATSRSRTMGADAASGPRPSIRRSGATRSR